jgi:DNA-binding LytR/AlgR family response regulator
MILKCLIVDDEPLAHQLLENYIGKLSFLEKIGNAYNAVEALSIIRSQNPDLVFLDINMPELSGLEMIKTLNIKPKIILTTAYSNHAIDAFDLGVNDYLLKPISFERFLKSVNRVYDMFSGMTQLLEPKTKSNTIYIKDGNQNIKLHFENILYLMAFGNFVKIFTENKTYLSSHTMKNMEQVLPENQFIRVHKSYIVNKAKIDKTEGNLVYISQEKIPIGNNYKLQVKIKMEFHK